MKMIFQFNNKKDRKECDAMYSTDYKKKKFSNEEKYEINIIAIDYDQRNMVMTTFWLHQNRHVFKHKIVK